MERSRIGVQRSALLTTGWHVGTWAVATAKQHDTKQQDQDDDDNAKHFHPKWRARGRPEVGPYPGGTLFALLPHPIPSHAPRLVYRQRDGRE